MNPTTEPLRAPEDPRDPERLPRTRSLLNRAAVRAFALEQSRQLRLGRFTRVSAGWLDDLEAQLRATIARRVHSAPSIGKTLQ